MNKTVYAQLQVGVTLANWLVWWTGPSPTWPVFLNNTLYSDTADPLQLSVQMGNREFNAGR